MKTYAVERINVPFYLGDRIENRRFEEAIDEGMNSMRTGFSGNGRVVTYTAALGIGGPVAFKAFGGMLIPDQQDPKLFYGICRRGDKLNPLGGMQYCDNFVNNMAIFFDSAERLYNFASKSRQNIEVALTLLLVRDEELSDFDPQPDINQLLREFIEAKLRL